MSYEQSKISSQWSREFQSDRWAKELPVLKFPSRWRVQVIPPFGGAVIRFIIYGRGKDYVSVYFDAYENLGFFGEPHWEAYPIGEDNVRWAMKNWKKMFRAIDKQLFPKKRKP